jgi:type II secretory pathway pseudopilin PulG
MSENRKKWSTYLLELLVVIIGISIAFSLENWSESKKKTKNEINYLSSLRTDLQEDIKEIQTIMDSSEVLIQNITELFSLLYRSQSSDEIKIHHVTSTYSAPYFNAKDGTYTSLVNSGALEIIENYELKSSISNLYNVHYDEMERLDDFVKNLVNNQIYPYMLAEIQFNRNGQGIVSSTPLKTVKSINFIGSYWNFLRRRNEEYKKVKMQCQEVLKEIDNELIVLE